MISSFFYLKTRLVFILKNNTQGLSLIARKSAWDQPRIFACGLELCSLIFYRAPGSGTRTCHDVWAGSFEPISYGGIVGSAFMQKRGAWAWLNLICHALLIPLGRPYLCWMETEEWMGTEKWLGQEWEERWEQKSVISM